MTTGDGIEGWLCPMGVDDVIRIADDDRRTQPTLEESIAVAFQFGVPIMWPWYLCYHNSEIATSNGVEHMKMSFAYYPYETRLAWCIKIMTENNAEYWAERTKETECSNCTSKEPNATTP